ncbi:MAG TPA: DsbE family thiol:disulfide interchange protein [Rhodocyclaceae bacterium]
MNRRALLPLAALAALLGVFAAGLTHDPREVPSPLIGKPAPAFTLPQLDDGTEFSPRQMIGRVWLLNVWASWCVSCRQEHQVLLQSSRTINVPIVGLDHKDRRADGLEWLREAGNPYLLSVDDADGRVGVDFGVYGVPETFLIDKQGVIRFKQIGPVTADVLQQKILPLVKELNG